MVCAVNRQILKVCDRGCCALGVEFPGERESAPCGRDLDVDQGWGSEVFTCQPGADPDTGFIVRTQRDC